LPSLVLQDHLLGYESMLNEFILFFKVNSWIKVEQIDKEKARSKRAGDLRSFKVWPAGRSRL
jgi:hypothetical protein